MHRNNRISGWKQAVNKSNSGVHHWTQRDNPRFRFPFRFRFRFRARCDSLTLESSEAGAEAEAGEGAPLPELAEVTLLACCLGGVVVRGGAGG